MHAVTVVAHTQQQRDTFQINRVCAEDSEIGNDDKKNRHTHCLHFVALKCRRSVRTGSIFLANGSSYKDRAERERMRDRVAR